MYETNIGPTNVEIIDSKTIVVTNNESSKPIADAAYVTARVVVS